MVLVFDNSKIHHDPYKSFIIPRSKNLGLHNIFLPPSFPIKIFHQEQFAIQNFVESSWCWGKILCLICECTNPFDWRNVREQTLSEERKATTTTQKLL